MAKDENKKIKKEKKENKENKNFFKSFKAELKKVVWPAPKQLANNTIAVITIVLITTAIVFALDFGFEQLNEHGIEKLKSAVESRTETNNVDTQLNTTDDENVNATENNVVENNSEEQASQEETTENTSSEENSNNEVAQ